VLQHLKAAHAGHHGIQKQKIKVTFPKPGKPCRAVFCHLNPESLCRQYTPAPFPNAQFIINDQHAHKSTHLFLLAGYNVAVFFGCCRKNLEAID
jgi:hypothetical protein